ncbi:MAG: DUF4105 domain-containing protein [Bacteroidetes bacterium]|nr:MAG: DUF4105 domain-containing protein [Bacteroidota bacterium]
MHRLSLLLSLLLTTATASAQLPDTLSAEARLSLLTILPGDAVYSAFGHSALRVHDPMTGFDAVFNYGTFDFRDPLFIPRFVYGKLDYYLSVVPLRATLRGSRLEGRPVIEQILALAPHETRAVYAALRHNARPENRTYRYDFLYDNCSTRPRDVLARTLGPVLQFSGEPAPRQSFRRLLDPYLADRPWLDLGIDLLLGIPTDRIPTPEQVVFLPDYLMAAFDEAHLVRDGETTPLVLRKDTLLAVPGYRRPAPAPNVPLWLFSLLFVAVAVTSLRPRSTPVSHNYRADALLFGLIGLVGFFLLFMWLGTEHHVTTWNANVLWALPTHALAAVALLRGGRSWLRPYFAFTFALTLFMVIAVLSDWPQDFPTAIFPLLLIIVLRSALLLKRLPPPRLPGRETQE